MMPATKEKSASSLYSLTSATDYLDRLLKKEITVRAYLEDCLRHYDRYEADIQAWAYFDRELVLARAAELDRRLSKSTIAMEQWLRKNPLYGVPIGIKDIFNTSDMPTEYGSSIFTGYKPGNDARVVTSIRRAQAVVMGKTITAELSVHTPGPTRNPIDHKRTPGTSSSGSAAAVASGMVPLALSSQTSGSTIRPASYCGIIGYKPSFGVLPRTAMLKTTDTLDTVGILGRCLSDILCLFDVLRVKGLNYPIVNQKLIYRMTTDRPWRVAFIRSPDIDKLTTESNDTLPQIEAALLDLSCEVGWVDLPEGLSIGESDKIQTLIYHRALAYYFKREWEEFPEHFSPCLADIIQEGAMITLEDYRAACGQQTEMMQQFQALFDQWDILLCPSALSEAPMISDNRLPKDYNHLVTLCHSPAMSLPLLQGCSGLPLGLQCIAKKYHDYTLFDFCDLLMKTLSPRAVA